METMFRRKDQIHDSLFVVTTVFNPSRYRSRWKLYEDFARRMERPDVRLYTVEVAFGERDFVLPETETTLRLRTNSEIWLKENALNLAIQRLPTDWKYVAWIDADVSFARDDWSNETLHRLQHHKIVQMWSEGYDLDDRHTVLQSFKSLGWSYANNIPFPSSAVDYYYLPGMKGSFALWHPGFAWAIRREAFDQLGGLIDWSILGNADTLMARSILNLPIGGSEDSLGVSGKRQLKIWQDRADKYILQSLGYVEGALWHYWHGPKADRQYISRNQILIKNCFEPDVDLKKDWQGLWALTDRSPCLRDDLRRYFNKRNEDAPY